MQGLATGEKEFSTHVVRNNQITFAFTQAQNPGHPEFSAHHNKHGDGVKDVAFTVDDARGIHDKAIAKGATSVRAPETITDENGTVILASVKTYGDTIHTFVQRSDYSGPFLPGYKAHRQTEVLNGYLPSPELLYIDHCVGNQPDGEMEPVARWYEQMLDFHRFWSVDDKQINTEFSSLRVVVVTDYDETIKMPINEPASGKRKSQIQEFCEYYGGAGVQHIAMRTENIIETVTRMKSRGVVFLDTIPDTYYEKLRAGLSSVNLQVQEDIDILQREKILVDYDEKGYLLQIFTKPLEDRPTLFLEVIQRRNHQGFGAGNFKALFESIEQEQALRGNL